MASTKTQVAVLPPVDEKTLVVAKAVKDALPAPMNAAEIANVLIAFHAEAAKAVEAATRIEVKDQASYDVATDVAASINTALHRVEKTRKSYTSPLDALKKKLVALFDNPGDRLQASLDAIKRKMGAWRAEEETRRRKEAAAEQARIEEEAQRLAEATEALGDNAGAQQIREAAAAIVVEPTKVTGTGAFGAAAVPQKRPSGTVTNKRAFLAWALQNTTPTVTGVLDAIDFGKLGLNSLAKELLEAKAPADAVPGFAFEYTETTGFRS